MKVWKFTKEKTIEVYERFEAGKMGRKGKEESKWILGDVDPDEIYTWEMKDDDEDIIIKELGTSKIVLTCKKSCFNDSDYTIRDETSPNQLHMILLHAPISKRYGY